MRPSLLAEIDVELTTMVPALAPTGMLKCPAVAAPSATVAVVPETVPVTYGLLPRLDIACKFQFVPSKYISAVAPSGMSVAVATAMLPPVPKVNPFTDLSFMVPMKPLVGVARAESPMDTLPTGTVIVVVVPVPVTGVRKRTGAIVPLAVMDVPAIKLMGPELQIKPLPLLPGASTTNASLVA